jgi:hypothetical protein
LATAAVHGEAPGFRVNLPVASLLFGVVSFCLPLAAAIPSWIFGLLALRAVRRQGGPVRARQIALLGMGLSGASTLFTLLGALVLAATSMLASKPSVPGTVAISPPPDQSKTEPVSMPDQSWKVIFRSADPSIWNDDINKGPDHVAMTLDLAPDNIRFLRLLDTKSKDFVIIEMTKDRLGKMTDDGRFGWDGRNQSHSQAYHLGIFHKNWNGGDRGEVCVCGSPNLRGWGFGHSAFVNDKQAFSWEGKPIRDTVFEIAVKAEPLTEVETKKLLKKGVVRN